MKREKGKKFFGREVIFAANQNHRDLGGPAFPHNPPENQTDFRIQFQVMARGKFKGKPKRGGNISSSENK